MGDSSVVLERAWEAGEGVWPKIRLGFRIGSRRGPDVHCSTKAQSPCTLVQEHAVRGRLKVNPPAQSRTSSIPFDCVQFVLLRDLPREQRRVVGLSVTEGGTVAGRCTRGGAVSGQPRGGARIRVERENALLRAALLLPSVTSRRPVRSFGPGCSFSLSWLFGWNRPLSVPSDGSVQ